VSSTKLLKFLQGVAQDAKMGKAFRADPDAMMKAARLSAAERAAVTSGDPERIRQALGTKGHGLTVKPLVMSVVVD